MKINRKWIFIGVGTVAAYWLFFSTPTIPNIRTDQKEFFDKYMSLDRKCKQAWVQSLSSDCAARDEYTRIVRAETQRNQARIEAYDAQIGVMDAANNASRTAGEAQQRIQNRNNASRDRMSGYSEGRAANAARVSGDSGGARSHQSNSDYYYGRSYSYGQ